MAVFAGLTLVTSSEIPWTYRLPLSLAAGLTLVRFFVLYHDHEHGTILSKSRLAKMIMFGVGVVLLNPPSVWRRSHGHHHVNNSRGFGKNVGSFPLLTVDAFSKASRWEQWCYAAQRHPLAIACGYFTVFCVGMCVAPLLANPRRHLDAAFSVLCHGLLLVLIGSNDWDDLWLVAVIPCALASAVGAYLFYAQHNFPGVALHGSGEWDHVSAALESSSYIPMNPVMCWFTGNIGYHHVHHLNAHIPFYRLPEAMAAIAELQSPVETTLCVRDIRDCLCLKLWDSVHQQLVPWPPRDPQVVVSGRKPTRGRQPVLTERAA